MVAKSQTLGAIEGSLDTTLSTAALMAGIASAGLIFQVGHFLEHAVQFGVWLLGSTSGICGRDTPWMSPWVQLAVENFGAWAWPEAGTNAQMARGMEVLHIVGNTIFLTALLALYYNIRSGWIIAAIAIETFHLYEHIMLTTTVFALGKAVGLSTLFGGAEHLSREAAVGVRVTWHFVMNLFPMPFAMMGLLERWWED